MKYVLIVFVITIFSTNCLGQQYDYYGSFSPETSPYFRSPIGSKVSLISYFNWEPDNFRIAPLITPSFAFDSSSATISSTEITFNTGLVATDSLYIIIKSDTPRCFIPPRDGIIASYNTYDSNVPLGLYAIQGVFYDPKIIGKVSGPDSLNFGAISIDSLAKTRLNIVNDSLAMYRRIIVLSVDPPFSLDDTIEMLYPCQYDYTANCSFHPTHPGHYVDTAKLLDPLTNDTISVVLIGDAYDAGVSEAAVPQVELYPNPCDRKLRLKVPDGEVSQIEIRNIFGEKVYSSTIENGAAIDCSRWAAGMYFVSVRRGNSWLNRKVIVGH